MGTLSKWYAALATGTAQIVVIGDSISEGTGASTVLNRWQTGLQTRLRGSVGGAIMPFIPAIPISTVTGWPVTRGGTINTNPNYGLGWRTVVLPDATSTMTFTFTGTSCKIMYLSLSNMGVMRISVDGGAGIVVDTNSTTAGPASPARTWSSGALTRGVHTVTITRDSSSTAGQSPYIEGLLTYDGDETIGIRVLDAAHSGWNSTNMNTGNNALNAAVAVHAAGDASLAIIGMGTNDAPVPTDPAVYNANIQNMITQLRANSFNGSIMLLNMYKGNTLDNTVYSQYGVQLAAIASADPDIVYLDLRQFMPDVPTPVTDPSGQGFYADNLHPSDAGHARIAQILYSVLELPLTAPNSVPTMQTKGDIRLGPMVFNTVDTSGCRWFVEDLDGWWGLPEGTVPDAPLANAEDGSEYIAGRYSPRKLVFTGRIVPSNPDPVAGKSAVLAARRAFLQSLNTVRTTTTLQVDEYDAPKMAAVQVSSPPQIDFVSQANVLSFSVELRAVDPRKYSQQLTTVVAPIYATAGGRSYARVYSWMYGVAGSTGEAVINNAGTYETNGILTITGPVTNPQVLQVDTGNYLLFNITIANGDYLVIDLSSRSVLLNGTSGRRSSLDPSSTWFTLPAGTSVLRYTGTAGIPATSSLTVQYRSAWLE